MCMGGDSAADKSAAEAKKASNEAKKTEKKRQKSVRKGQGVIEDAFAQYNDDYYGGFKQDYLDYYTPQIEREYGRTRGKLFTGLLERGIGESTVGAHKLADLQRRRDEEHTNAANQATDAANALRAKVENEKTNLYTLNLASADPQAINARAIGSATALAAPQAYSPVGQIFASALQPLTYGVSAYNNRSTQSYQSPFTRVASGSGSGRVVG
jgi:hypothetical protein